jgi:acetyl esterase
VSADHQRGECGRRIGRLPATADDVAVSGDSAGANLAAAVALMARDQRMQLPRFQLLFCPVTHYSFESQSYIDNAVGYGLTADTMKWFWRNYLKHADDGKNVYASPLLAPDLSGLPPALIITAEYDP